METPILQRTLTSIVEDNYVYAHVLYYFGIRFYEYADDTLENVCRRKGLNSEQILRSMERENQLTTSDSLTFESLPIDLVLEYLRHSHGVFIKQTLPYMAHLVETIRHESSACVKDLQLLLPLFIEDFIIHIHEEEDTFFQYLQVLQQAKQHKIPSGKVFFELEKQSVQRFAIEHETHDDEMEGIRDITNNYTLPADHSLHLKVVFAELKAFEQSLVKHARIENEILFPKALMLEKEVKDILRKAAQWN